MCLYYRLLKSSKYTREKEINIKIINIFIDLYQNLAALYKYLKAFIILFKGAKSGVCPGAKIPIYNIEFKVFTVKKQAHLSELLLYIHSTFSFFYLYWSHWICDIDFLNFDLNP